MWMRIGKNRRRPAIERTFAGGCQKLGICPDHCLNWCVFILILLFASTPMRAAETASALEYKIKAGYLFNLAKFIEWPAGSLPFADSLFTIAVLDEGEAFAVIQSVLEGKQVNGHLMKVKSVRTNLAEKDFQILFVTRAAGKSPQELRPALAGIAALLVGETDQFAERGGMVGFVREQEAIHLTLNLERTTAARLKVSARLASVARLVKSLDLK
jgi:hypothetical protein